MAKGQVGMIQVIPVSEYGDSTCNHRRQNSNGDQHGNQELGWESFTQDTTLHGIRFIFQRSHHIVRRLLWTSFVVASIVLFVVQVYSRVKDYYSYESNVNMKYHYNGEVTMPAVAVCNHNRYRITQAASEGVYDFLNSYYSSTSNRDFVIEKYRDVLDIDYERLIEVTGHQQNDFIEKCLWRGQTCPHDAFAVTFTDIGMCYTFNGGAEPLQVKDTGSEAGLRLFLNVEQYEHMAGPVGDAGAKILLHSPGEAPLMGDLGFSAAPGKHTLVSVKRTEFRNRGPPYSDCQEGAPTMSACKAGKWSEHIEDNCGCSAIQYRNSTQDMTRACNMTDVFGCVHEHYGNVNGTQQCAMPCQSVSYDPTISFAELSSFNVDSLVLRDMPARRKYITDKFHYANEIAERVDPQKRAVNVEDMKTIRPEMNNVLDLVTDVLKIYHSTNATADHYQVGDLLGHGKAAIKNLDSQEKRNYLRQKSLEVHSFDIHISNLMDMVNRIVNASLEIFHSKIAPGFDACDRISDPTTIDDYWFGNKSANSNTTLASCLLYMSFVRNVTNSTLHMTYSTSGQKSKNRKKCFNDKSPTLNGGMLSFADLLEDYQRNISSWYTGTYQDPNKITGHIQCNDSLTDPTISTTLVGLDLVIHTMELIFHSTKYTKVRNNVVFLNSTARLTGVFDMGFEDRLNKALAICKWMQKYNYLCEHHEDHLMYKRYLDLNSEALSIFSDFAMQLNKTISATQRLLTTFSQGLYGSISGAISAYERKNMTKLKLAEYFTTYTLKTKRRELLALVESVEDKYSSLESFGVYACSTIYQVFDTLFALKLPILNDRLLLTSDFFEKILIQSRREDIIGYIRKFTTNHAYYMELLFEAHCLPYTSEVVRHKRLLTRATGQLFSGMDSYTDKLNIFKQSAATNGNFFLKNFLQVDIFYRELRYETIVHQPSFATLSLFSEVGGFLGLLLGGSLLTVCELLDFLARSLLLKIDAMKNPEIRRKENKLNPV